MVFVSHFFLFCILKKHLIKLGFMAKSFENSYCKNGPWVVKYARIFKRLEFWSERGQNPGTFLEERPGWRMRFGRRTMGRK